MKIILSCNFFLILSIVLFAQSPHAINYQGVARGPQGKPLTNKNIYIRLSILDSSATGQALFVESHNLTTNNTGHFNLSISGGTVVSGIFENIAWGKGGKWLQIEIDTIGGSNYLHIGTTQFLSVPYALYSKTSSIGPFYLGKDTLGGIVFYIYIGSDGFQHGLIISKTETIAQWQTTYSQVNANSWDDGYYNTNLISNSPARNWVQGFGVEWYIPSKDELNLMLMNRFHINKSLRSGGFPEMKSMDYFWSSTEEDGGINRAWAHQFSYDSPHPALKDEMRTVRAIRSF